MHTRKQKNRVHLPCVGYVQNYYTGTYCVMRRALVPKKCRTIASMVIKELHTKLGLLPYSAAVFDNDEIRLSYHNSLGENLQIVRFSDGSLFTGATSCMHMYRRTYTIWPLTDDSRFLQILRALGF